MPKPYDMSLISRIQCRRRKPTSPSCPLTAVGTGLETCDSPSLAELGTEARVLAHALYRIALAPAFLTSFLKAEKVNG